VAPTVSLTSSAADRVKADLLAVPVFAERELGPGAQDVDDAIGGGLAEFMAEADFSGKRGETLAVPTGGNLGAKAVVLVGVGARGELNADASRRR
jgi:leucyl aminopeptidase